MKRNYSQRFGSMMSIGLVLSIFGLALPILALSEEGLAADTEARSDDLYRAGRDALEAGEWQSAVGLFSKVEESGSHADAALYWIAYAQHQGGREEQALRTLDRLREKSPQSRWLDDAEALEVELRGVGEGTIDPDIFDGDELKLLALNSLMHTDSERALDLLTGMLEGDHSPQLKERALFVLSQNSSSRATKLLAQIATGGVHGGLKTQAVRMLGISGGGRAIELLQQIYRDTADPEVRRAVLESYMIAGAGKALAVVARSEKNLQLRQQAIRLLGANGDMGLLGELWSNDAPAPIRQSILEGMMIAGDHAGLVKVALRESDPELRRHAIELLGAVGGSEVSAALSRLYRQNTDLETRRAVMRSWMISDDAESLVKVARSEQDPQLKRQAVELLSVMDQPEARDYMLELLGQ